MDVYHPDFRNCTFTVENTGSAALILSAAPALTGTNTADFAIAAGSTCTNGATVAAGLNRS
jgi:hypothetical protein